MGSEAPAIDAERVIADLRALADRTGDERGAQRLCWTEPWRAARELLAELLAEVGVEAERDEAGNLWARLAGEREPALALGSHIDSVPDGGWLDGALGVMAAVGVLRAWSASGRRPPRSVVLVDWADEEGARFGNSLFGSSAFAGRLDLDEVRDLRDAEGKRPAEALAENGIDLERAIDAAERREGLAAYLELHIEQGPILEAESLHAAAVEGCVGIERHRFRFGGQASHAGTTPMELRADAGLAAAEAALGIELVGRRHGGVATTGSLTLAPGIATAVAGEADLVVDLRHPDTADLASMLAAAGSAGSEAAKKRGCEFRSEAIWSIEPTRFDAELVSLAGEVVAERTGTRRVLTSGALHDAAQVARVVPAAMLFVPSTAGISHAREEDTPEADLRLGIETFGALAGRVAARPGQRRRPGTSRPGPGRQGPA